MCGRVKKRHRTQNHTLLGVVSCSACGRACVEDEEKSSTTNNTNEGVVCVRHVWEDRKKIPNTKSHHGWLVMDMGMSPHHRSWVRGTTGRGWVRKKSPDTFSLTRDGVVVDTLLLLLVVVIVRCMASGRWWWCGCRSQGGGVGCHSTREGGWRSRGGRSTVQTNLVTDPSPAKTGTGMLRVIFFSPVPVPWYPVPVTRHGVTYLCPSLRTTLSVI